jgi:hypothetical protein
MNASEDNHSAVIDREKTFSVRLPEEAGCRLVILSRLTCDQLQEDGQGHRAPAQGADDEGHAASTNG